MDPVSSFFRSLSLIHKAYSLHVFLIIMLKVKRAGLDSLLGVYIWENKVFS